MKIDNYTIDELLNSEVLVGFHLVGMAKRRGLISKEEAQKCKMCIRFDANCVWGKNYGEFFLSENDHLCITAEYKGDVHKRRENALWDITVKR